VSRGLDHKAKDKKEQTGRGVTREHFKGEGKGKEKETGRCIIKREGGRREYSEGTRPGGCALGKKNLDPNEGGKVLEALGGRGKRRGGESRPLLIDRTHQAKRNQAKKV